MPVSLVLHNSCILIIYVDGSRKVFTTTSQEQNCQFVLYMLIASPSSPYTLPSHPHTLPFTFPSISHSLITPSHSPLQLPFSPHTFPSHPHIFPSIFHSPLTPYHPPLRVYHTPSNPHTPSHPHTLPLYPNLMSSPSREDLSIHLSQ